MYFSKSDTEPEQRQGGERSQGDLLSRKISLAGSRTLAYFIYEHPYTYSLDTRTEKPSMEKTPPVLTTHQERVRKQREERALPLLPSTKRRLGEAAAHLEQVH